MADWTVEIDPDLCIGAGECVLAAPDSFELPDDDPIARVLPGAATALLDDLDEAARQCPTGAITVSPG